MQRYFIREDKTIGDIPVPDVKGRPSPAGWWVRGALAEKIMEHMPFFDFVLDDDGKLVDIKPDKKARKAFEQAQATAVPAPTLADLTLAMGEVTATISRMDAQAGKQLQATEGMSRVQQFVECAGLVPTRGEVAGR